MAPPKEAKVLQIARVSPQPDSVPETSLPLTFFDAFWLEIPPIQRLLFYHFPHPKTHFLQSLLPPLKHSLSLALQLFFPLAGSLTISPNREEHEIRYRKGDSVALTVAESDSDFYGLVADHPKDAAEFRPLVPELPTSDLLSLQLTLFPDSGLCIGICFHHVAADGCALTHFMKSWSSINRTSHQSSVTSLPFHDRTVIEDPCGLKRLFMQQMREIRFGESVERPVVQPALARPAPVLATFSLTSSDIQALRARVDSCPNSPPCSTFALSCGYVWVCLVKARGQVGDKPVYFSFSADCRTRLKPAVSDTYFGNCILSVFAEAMGSDLAREDGVVIATMAIAKAVRGLENGGALRGAESLIPTFATLGGERVVILAGSPRFRVYEMDFGWGRPRKTEVVSIERTEGVYIGDSREEDGGIEFGLAMPKSEMDVFASFFQEGLKC